jgi:hypothetical protein
VLVEEPSIQEEVQIERVPGNQLVDEPVAVRCEGDTMIIPVIEEVVVVETRLQLKEEVRVTKRQISHVAPSASTACARKRYTWDRSPPGARGPASERDRFLGMMVSGRKF